MNEVTGEKQEILCLVTLTEKKGLLDQVDAIKSDMNNDSRFNVEIEYIRSNKQAGELIQRATPSPHIIHIAAESPKDGKVEICDPDNDKEEDLMPNILAGFFANTKNINCVVLNFCYSTIVAELIADSEFEKHDGVQCVIAIDGRIEIQGAANFSSIFYKALKGNFLNPKIIQEAFEKGKAAANDRKTEGEGEYCIFQKQIQQPEMSIKTPDNETKVRRECKCKGTFKNLYKGASMWAYVKPMRDDYYYILPIDKYSRDSKDGEWEVTQIVGTPEGDDDDYRIGVFMVDPENTPKFQSHYKNADKSQGYKLLSLPTKEIEFAPDENDGTERIVKRQ